MKQFYSCIDVTMPAPQPEQHMAAIKTASLNNGQVVSYGAEDIINYKKQMFIFSKLKKIIDEIDGVIFFSFDQFCYSDKINLKLIREILDLDLEVHFSRESISILNINDFYSASNSLIAYYYSRSISVESTILKISTT